MAFIPAFLAVAMMPVGPGLQTIDMVLGKGTEARPKDSVTVRYKGWLQADGKVFDENTGKDKPPFTFTLGAGQVIKGWDEGVVGMKIGGKRLLCLPPEYAYGEKGVGPIPGNSTLLFEVELLKVDKPGAQPEGKPMIEILEIAAGTGEGAKMGDTVEVHYTGTFPSGEKFDSSRDPGRTPLKVEIGKTGLIKGFTDGLIGMKLGGKRKITIPYQLAYGEAGRPPAIPPKSTLVFELEIMSLKPG